MSMPSRWLPSLALLLAGALCAAAAGAAPAAAPAAPPAEGLRWQPTLGWSRGPHQLELHANTRFRFENWDARADEPDSFYALRTRVNGRYAFGEHFALFAEGQYTQLWDLDPSASGAASNYLVSSPEGDSESPEHLVLRQLYADLRFAPASLRIGRHDINQGTLIKYEEPAWNYVKQKRLSQRLVGTVGWTHAERTYQGASGTLDLAPGYFVHAFAAEPTTGVFDVPGAYQRQKNIAVGGVDLTVKRGVWLPNTEFGLFGIAYEDSRSEEDGKPSEADPEVFTVGASWLGVYPLGPGAFDTLLWGAFQWGEFPSPAGEDQQHQAAAGIAELGYQLTQCWSKPWLRLGVNVASGDSSPDSGEHKTFFNLLPTNHLYYGYADQLAFQNLWDFFVQLMVSPLPGVSLELTGHRFRLYEREDARYFGTGAYDHASFGISSSSSNGSADVGWEFDAVASWKLNDHVALEAGSALMWGGDVFAGGRRDTQWHYAQLTLSY